MIEITLRFTSVALAAAALNQLNGTQLAAATVVEVPSTAEMVADLQAKNAVTKAAAPKPKAEKPAPVVEKQEPVVPEKTPEPVAAAASASTQPSAATGQTAAPTVAYPDLQKKVFQLASLSRDAASACASSFGVKTFKDLDASRWGEALAAVNAAIEAQAEVA